tara:strand:+ start:6318 stop:6677 length:360 start_codon:yes stop_codon:yes gene_type:complete
MNTISDITPSLALVIRLVEEFRKLGPQVPIQVMQVYCEIARDPDVSMKDLGLRTGLQQSSVSRAISSLSSRNRHDKSGMNLVVSKEDPMNRRRKTVRLTHTGKLVAKALGEAVSHYTGR